MRSPSQSPVSRWHLQRRLLATLAVSVLVVTGCSDGDEPTEEPTTQPTDSGSTAEPTEPTESSEPPEPTETPEPTEPPEPRPDPTPPPPAPVGFRGALMPAQSLPTPGDAPPWRSVRTTRGEGGDRASVCQVTELASLGATRTMTRQYASGELSATHLVARFGDDVSAARTYEVLETWLSECGDRLAGEDLEVTKQPAGFDAGPDVGDRTGWAWLAYGPVPGEPDASNIEVQALLHSSRTLSWVIWRQVGQDYSYPPGRTPPETALPLMAQRLTGQPPT